MKAVFEYGPTVIKWILLIIGGFSTVLLVFGSVRGVFKILWKLGKSLYKRKITLYAESNIESLKNLLIDSQFIKEKNLEIVTKAEIDKGAENSMMIVYYPDFKDEILEILKYKKDSDSLIVYAPHSKGTICDREVMNEICNRRNTILVTMRGRLLNDLLTAMITTKYA